MKPHLKLLLGLVLGIAFGTLLHPLADQAWLVDFNTHLLQPVGQVFLRLIFMIVVPMVFSALVLGVYELGQGHGLGRVAGRTLLYTVVASSVSVLIGITLVNVFRPGAGFQIDAAMVQSQQGAVQKIQGNASAAKPVSQALVELIPRNPLDSAVRALEGEMLALMVFALVFGLALALVSRGREGENVLVQLLNQVFAVCMKIVEFAMKIAPYAVFAIVFNTAFKFGYQVFGSLLFYVAIVVAGLLIQQFVVYTALLKTVARRSPWEFFRKCREVYLYAFSTASSNATLPLSLETAEHVLKLPPRISRFVLTVGSTANQNGTALFEGITVLFLAQVYAVDLTLGQQIQVVLMSILAGIGTAGIPGGSLPLIMILLTSVGIPAEGMGLILGVDRFLDMCRTTLNVSGDLVIAALVSAPETRKKSS
jgi:DAACS family dicarboxylate/amino acid:cation (Na+ or H+) symporter